MKISTTGLWSNNPALVQLLGLCPLLATSNTLVNGLAMGIATTLVLLLAALCISSLRNFIPNALRLPIFMLIIASSVTAIEIIMQAQFYALYINLGIFIPLIVTNCIIIGRSEAFASKNNISASLLDGFIMGLGFTWVMVLLGAIREILSKGTLFSGLEMLLGNNFIDSDITVLNPQLFLLAALPAGAFIGFGFILAGKQAIDQKRTNQLLKNLSNRTN